MRSTLLVLATALAFFLPGCGLDGDLTCGFTTCAPSSDAQARDATSTEPADGMVDGREAATVTVGARDGAATDSSMLGSIADGGGSEDAAPLLDGCVMCGTAPCCGPTHQCIASGTTCCGNTSASCGGEQGSCCQGLVCTAARRCGPGCASMGSCAQQSDCCLGTYCDTSLQCVSCLLLNTACSQPYECCSGTCRNSVCANE